MTRRARDYASVVRANWAKTRGYLLAGREPCIRMRDEEVGNVRRVLLAVHPDDLSSIKLSRSWILGVILCPGDSSAAVAEWVKTRRALPSRVWFFLHPDTDLAALRDWKAAGYATDQVDVVASWQEIHPLFGAALSDQVYADFRSE